MRHYVYLVGNMELNWFKIGRTTSPQNRLKSIQHGVPFPVQMFRSVEAPSAALAGALEADLLGWYLGTHIRGEWYRDVNVLEFPEVVASLAQNIQLVEAKTGKVFRRLQVRPGKLTSHNAPLVRRRPHPKT